MSASAVRLATHRIGTHVEVPLPMPARLVHALGNVLPKAGMLVRPEAYLAATTVQTACVFLGGLALAVMAQIVAAPAGAAAALLWLVPLFAAASWYGVRFWLPWNRAAERRKQIDARLPFALNYIATMAGAGMAPDRIFWSLGRQRVYGEVAVESSIISRDLNALGLDLGRAFRLAMDRTPSRMMAGFLQGAITTLSTGEDLGHYFLVKSKQFAFENRQNERRFLEGMGTLAESYVTLIVAAPIFVIVMLSVMIVFGGTADQMLGVGYMLVLVLIPMAQAAFAATLQTITPEV